MLRSVAERCFVFFLIQNKVLDLLLLIPDGLCLNTGLAQVSLEPSMFPQCLALWLPPCVGRSPLVINHRPWSPSGPFPSPGLLFALRLVHLLTGHLSCISHVLAPDATTEFHFLHLHSSSVEELPRRLPEMAELNRTQPLSPLASLKLSSHSCWKWSSMKQLGGVTQWESTCPAYKGPGTTKNTHLYAESVKKLSRETIMD